jgi:23S rRNA maturation mini-RNase III
MLGVSRDKNKRKIAWAGLMKQVIAADKKEAARNNGHLITVVNDEGENGTMKRGCETPMERRKKSDEESRRVPTKLTLLIGCNFLRNYVSNLVECSGRELHYSR